MRFLTTKTIGSLVGTAVILAVSVPGRSTAQTSLPPPMDAFHGDPLVGQAKSNSRPDDMVFVQNKGQWDSHVKFFARGPRVDMWLTDDGITYDYHQGVLTQEPKDSKSTGEKLIRSLDGTLVPAGTLRERSKSKLFDLRSEVAAQRKARNVRAEKSTRSHVVKVSFVGAGTETRVEGLQKKPYTFNYFIGNDRSKWASNVPVFSSATIKGLYKGVDVVAYFDQKKGMPRYDLVVHPGANVSHIAMKYKGARNLHISREGTVAYSTSVGSVEERDLLAYQPKPGQGIEETRQALSKGAKTPISPVTARMELGENGLVALSVGRHDPSRTLVIDPLIWSSYLGGVEDDEIWATQVDQQGYVYVAGTSGSPDFPIAAGAYQPSSPGSVDALFVSKFTPDGSDLEYSTFIGGSGYQRARSLAVESSGAVVVAGTSYSSDYPTTDGAMQPNYPGNIAGVVTKLSPDGSSLVYSTYVGNEGGPFGQNTQVNAIAMDSSGAVYLTGSTYDPGLATPGAIRTDGIGADDQEWPIAFCMKLNSNGARQFGTYIGGHQGYFDSGEGIAVDASGKVYVTGYAEAPTTDFPTTPGAFQTSAVLDPSNGADNAFVVKLSGNGTHLDYGTLLSGSDSSYGWGIKADSTGAAYVTGQTLASDFPTTSGVLQASFPGNGASGYVIKLSSDGSSLVYSTFLGAQTWTRAKSILIDGEGCAYIGGSMVGVSPIDGLTGQFQAANVNDTIDSFVAKLSANGSTLLAGTYIGGSAEDYGNAIALGSANCVYLGGISYSIDFPTSGKALQVLNQGEYDGYIAKLNLNPGPSVGFTNYAVTGGLPAEGYVLLASPATGSGVTVNLHSASPLVGVPSNVVVPNGETKATFAVTTKGVDTPTLVDVKATVGSTSADRHILLLSPEISALSISPRSVYGGSQNAKGTVTINAPAGAAGVGVTLTWTGGNVVSPPTTLTIPRGRTSATFSIGTHVVSTPKTITVGAVSNGSQASGDFDVLPIRPSSISVTPTTLVAGTSYIGYVSIPCPAPADGFVVKLVSSDPANLSIPSSVTVPAGQNRASFNVTTNPHLLGAGESVTLTASANLGKVTSTVNLRAVYVTRIGLSPSAVKGGTTSTLTVVLSAAAPVDTTVALTSSAPGVASVPTTLVIHAGSTSGTVTVTTSPVGVRTAAMITAGLHGSSRTAQLIVNK